MIADDPGLVDTVGKLTGGGGKQEKRQDEQTGGQVGQQVRIGAAETVDDDDGECGLEQIVVEGAKKLGQKQRQETSGLEQRELLAGGVIVRDRLVDLLSRWSVSQVVRIRGWIVSCQLSRLRCFSTFAGGGSHLAKGTLPT